jgi:hypothetical protein
LNYVLTKTLEMNYSFLEFFIKIFKFFKFNRPIYQKRIKLNQFLQIFTDFSIAAPK